MAKETYVYRDCFGGYIVFTEMFFHVDTKASEKLSELLSNKRLLTDISRLSPHYQTSSLEFPQCFDPLRS